MFLMLLIGVLASVLIPRIALDYKILYKKVEIDR